jgi:methylmalonyl-CoA/ethylmalonyl-CoA epimerase
MIQGVDHIGIAVRDLDASIALYMKIFQLHDMHREQVPDQGVDIASFALNGVRIELTAPLNADSPIAKFLEKRGEGIHHVAFRTDTINEDLQRLADSGIRLITTEPQFGAHDMLIAFLHPSTTGGVLMELCSEKP